MTVVKEDKSVIILRNAIGDKKTAIEEFQKNWKGDFDKLRDFFQSFEIASSTEEDVIKPYFKDWSNIQGFGEILLRPSNYVECAIILRTCYLLNIHLTISAGRTNLTGSATPMGGVILSTNNLTKPSVELNIENQEATCPVGIPLEVFREEILKLSKNNLYYPSDPTSRNDAFVGGTISTNASGFIPGERGATRYWVREVRFLFPNGDMVDIRRGQYISKNGEFKLSYEGKSITLPVPTYERPKIKNASGIFSDENGVVDLLDLIIGSEGILGMVVSCKLGLDLLPEENLELFISLKDESSAIDFHDFLTNHFDKEFKSITAMEYFGYNSQKYMRHKEFLFSNENDVGIYLQIPIHDDTIEQKTDQWSSLFHAYDPSMDLDNIIVLNDPSNWKRFFEARHSIPDNALTKSKRLGGISIITDTIVPKDNFRLYLKKVHAKLNKAKIEYLLFGHLGDCHLHFHLIPKKSQEDSALKIYDYLIDLSTKLGGVYSAEHGTGKRKRNDFKKCYGNEAVKMVKRLKDAIDPHNYLNNGNLFS